LTDGAIVVLQTATRVQTEVATITYTASNGERAAKLPPAATSYAD